MQMGWARIFVCALFVWSAAAGAASALCAPASSAHCSEMVVNDCVPVTTDEATPAGGCLSLACSFFVQVPACCSGVAYTGRILDLLMKFDIRVEGLSISPDLRPPIFQ